ncbi:MAG TPA: class I SAM-dependent methyltransferase [Methylomusa anaerophila]|uniref:Glycine/sarcosine N-methyltransferase n=1 Tax=Methylomusa anaerophila TaxID=1930071 RepID=A0A348APS9_9FIRM|nr:class I SAM-dependent methyltransferase [Methylomusa anaerophila]BBB93077.1 glycine/sarcosine N-methyltransferase [Methylomusa anaerophila]HML87090.1 class I SAM-dependent methyltransferase [Methylomusa anaerophila]
MAHDLLGDFKAYSLAGTEREVRFITSVLNLPTGAAILDLYCGYGRHAIELAKLGYQIKGVDGTQDFLDIALQKAKEAHVDIDFLQCDMRLLSFYQQFDAVINMFAAFGYFSDQENADVIKLVAQSLRPSGLFLIDLLNRDWMVRNNLNRYWRHPNGEYVLSYKVELQNGIATMKRQLINQVTGNKIQYEFVLRAYSLPEMTNILANSGFKILAAYGGFDGRTYSAETPRMIILAEKE